MADFKLQLVFRPHTDTEQPSGVQIKDASERALSAEIVRLTQWKARYWPKD